MDMIRCSDCGARNAETATFCVRCGAPLAGAPEAEQAPGQDTDRLEPASEADEAEHTLVMDAPPAPDEEAGDAEGLLHEASQLLAAGDPDGAAARCREAIEVAPDLVAAYSLLGMAEEQRGNAVAAAGAYRRVLQLDPGRTVEREKLEALYESGEASRPEGEGLGAEAERSVLRWAPWVAAAGAAFIVLVILTLVGVHLHAGWAQERVHSEQMATARAALDSGDYASACEAFEAALRVKPEDQDAQEGLRYARRKLRPQTAQPARAVRPVPSPRIASSPGPNPFQPIPIGADEEEPERQPQQPARTRAPRPPVVTSERVRSSDTSPAGPAETEVVPFGPLEEGPGEPGGAATGEDHEEPITDQELEVERRPQGTVHIEFVDRPPAAEAEREQGEGEPQPSLEQARRAASLRAQAEQARRSGNSELAAELYQQAIGAYRQDMDANPGNREADQAAIEACERARNLCTAAEGQ